MGIQITDIGKIFIRQKQDIKVAVDMTAGRGNDSKFILDNTNVRKLYAFDIQDESKKATESLIGPDDRFSFIKDSHENIRKYIKTGVDLAIYNLGYLPGGDKSITTNYKSTIKSLREILGLLNKGARLIMTVYPGHPQGKIESEKIGKFLENIDPKTYPVLKIAYENRPNNPPYVLVIDKKD